MIIHKAEYNVSQIRAYASIQSSALFLTVFPLQVLSQ